MPDQQPTSEQQVRVYTEQAAALLNHHQRTGQASLLDRAIADLRRAGEFAAAGRPVAARLAAGNLASALLLRFDVAGDRRDLTEVFGLLGEEARAGANPHEIVTLVAAMRKRYQLDQEWEVLDRTIGICRLALTQLPGEEPERGTLLAIFGGALLDRFHRTFDLDDLAGAIEAFREAATVPGMDPTLVGRFLGLALRYWYERMHDEASLTESVRLLRQAAAGVPDRPGGPDDEVLSQAGVALRYWYEHTGDPAALAESGDLLRRSLEAPAIPVAQRVRRQNSLAAVLLRQFEQTGDPDLLADAIAILREVVRSSEPDDPGQAGWHSNLAAALRQWFLHFGDLAALQEGIRLLRHALALEPTVPWEPADTGVLSAFTAALQDLHQRTGDPASAAEAVAVARELLVRSSGSERTSNLGTLANALRCHAQATADPGPLQEALQLLAQAVSETPYGHPAYGRHLTNLGNAWLEEYSRSGSQSALAEAVRWLGRAVRADSVPEPRRARDLRMFGTLLLDEYDRTGDDNVLVVAAGAFTEAAESRGTPPLLRVLAADNLAGTLAVQDDWHGAAAAGELAVGLIPQSATRRLRRADQEYGLTRLVSIAANAAACAVRAGDNARALGLLEQGRGVLLGQDLESRDDDLSTLRDHHPELALRWSRLEAELDALEDASQAQEAAPPSTAAGSAAARGHRLTQEREALLAHVRSLPGFTRFLAPPSVPDLLAHADQGPVVLLNVSAHSSDALVLTPDGVSRIPLPELSPATAAARTEQFRAALAAAEVPGADEPRAQRAVADVLEWLWDAVTGPVLDGLGLVGPAGDTWPRVWWSPGGPLASLPLHAAGHHQDRGAPRPRTVLDRVVSSYTPTVRALGYARSLSRQPFTSTDLLVVAMPETPGAAPLGGVHREVAALRRLWPTRELVAEEATYDAVRAALQDHVIVHFACHGVSDPHTPSASRLLLHDHATRPLTVLELSRLRLTRARLAVLSACGTARGAEHLPDEAIHLASACQLAGYPHVIGTLWPVNDLVAGRLAEGLYTGLREPEAPGPDPSRAAAVLHQVVRGMRNRYPQTPTIWAGHIHSGA